MPRAKRDQRYIEGSTCRRRWRPPRKKKAIPMHLTDGKLLAPYKNGRSRMCKKMPRLPSVSQFDVEHGHPIAFPHLGA